MLIGGQDILLPTTMVGNYPNPRWYDGHAFATLPIGEFIHDSISKEAFEDVVGAIVREPHEPARDAQFLASRTGARVAVLASSVGAVPEARDYISLIDYDVRALSPSR